ncbi:hypothetical protein Bbelb_078410 [Branchiostoma belcheri]|nr:hypothetical protein Bbelb_078410 [Branchiostoma belcheri]
MGVDDNRILAPRVTFVRTGGVCNSTSRSFLAVKVRHICGRQGHLRSPQDGLCTVVLSDSDGSQEGAILQLQTFCATEYSSFDLPTLRGLGKNPRGNTSSRSRLIPTFCGPAASCLSLGVGNDFGELCNRIFFKAACSIFFVNVKFVYDDMIHRKEALLAEQEVSHAYLCATTSFNQSQTNERLSSDSHSVSSKERLLKILHQNRTTYNDECDLILTPPCPRPQHTTRFCQSGVYWLSCVFSLPSDSSTTDTTIIPAGSPIMESSICRYRAYTQIQRHHVYPGTHTSQPEQKDFRTLFYITSRCEADILPDPSTPPVTLPAPEGTTRDPTL